MRLSLSNATRLATVYAIVGTTQPWARVAITEATENASVDSPDGNEALFEKGLSVPFPPGQLFVWLGYGG